MTAPARRFVRGIALALLFVAAVDLALPSQCSDEAVSTRAQPIVSDGAGPAGPAHECDDCFCCSRTVRIANAAAVPALVPQQLSHVPVLPAPRRADVRLLYHPPIL